MHIGLHPDIGRHDADRVTTLGDDRMDADHVVVIKGLALAMDRIQRNLRGRQRVDAALRCPAGMRGATSKPYLLDDGAVRRICGEYARMLLVVRGEMKHRRHVDVVEMALCDKFGLADQELDLALLASLQSFLNVD